METYGSVQSAVMGTTLILRKRRVLNVQLRTVKYAQARAHVTLAETTKNHQLIRPSAEEISSIV